ncbi:MAG: hypothetical protein K6C34_01225 [Alphaproteobacteria bacterium]|nr:hypothetical protein [Alphaproteobacteria bacterium]
MKKIVLFSAFAGIISFAPSYGDSLISYEAGEEVSENVDGVDESSSDFKDSITLSSAYFENQYTNKQLANFGLELIRGTDRLEKSFITNSEGTEGSVAKWGMRAFYVLFIHRAFNTAFHEIGHGLRVRAYGHDFMLSEMNNHGKFKKDENFFKYFVKKLGKFSRSSCKYEVSADSKDDPAKQTLVVSAGGMNNEMYLAERISQDFHKRGHLGFAESFAYFYNRLSPMAYALSKKDRGDNFEDDPIAVQYCYKELGISAKKNDIALSGVISALLSGTTYSIGKYAFSSEQCATPISFYNFQAPDVFSYITSKGISYKLDSAYKYSDDMKFLFGAEHVFHGQATTELHLGVDFTVPSVHNANLKAIVTLGRGFDLEAICSVPVTDCLSINVEAGTYSTKSLLGERHARNLNKGRSNDIAVSVSYKY